MKCVHIQEKNIAGNRLDLIPMGDWHLGSKECRTDKIDSMLKWVKDNPNARVILMGDIMNLGTRDSVGGGVFDDDFEPQAQYELVLEMLEPIKDKIYGYLVGNHEENRIRAKTSIDLSKNLCRELDIKFCGFSTFFKIKFGKENYTIYATHGSSGALLPHTKIKAAINLANYFEAEIYLHGHLHELATHTGLYYKIDMRHAQAVEHKKFYVLTGSFLDYENSYAQAKNYGPVKMGCPKIKLYKDKHSIHISL